MHIAFEDVLPPGNNNGAGNRVFLSAYREKFLPDASKFYRVAQGQSFFCKIQQKMQLTGGENVYDSP